VERLLNLVGAAKHKNAALPLEDRLRYLHIRFNPDCYRVNGVARRVPLAQRHAAVLRELEYPPALEYELRYCFYNTVLDEVLPNVVRAGHYPPELRALVRPALPL
jgi:hypothetical protein